ncbi:MAG: acyl-CoA thioesterase [Flavobacteriales bacterium]|nr:acyl-CoA thioesterase [Flavobacteriales bacterium]
MDEVAFIAATRFSRKKVVTLSSDRIDFKEPIPADTIMELVAQVSSVGTTSLQVRVEIFQEEMYRPGTRRKSITGQFIFVALDEHNKPTSVL